MRRKDWQGLRLVLSMGAIFFGVADVLPDPLWGGLTIGLGWIILWMIMGRRETKKIAAANRRRSEL